MTWGVHLLHKSIIPLPCPSSARAQLNWWLHLSTLGSKDMAHTSANEEIILPCKTLSALSPEPWQARSQAKLSSPHQRDANSSRVRLQGRGSREGTGWVSPAQLTQPRAALPHAPTRTPQLITPHPHMRVEDGEAGRGSLRSAPCFLPKAQYIICGRSPAKSSRLIFAWEE